jgi:hypothetical protein
MPKQLDAWIGRLKAVAEAQGNGMEAVGVNDGK